MTPNMRTVPVVFLALLIPLTSALTTPASVTDLLSDLEAPLEPDWPEEAGEPTADQQRPECAEDTGSHPSGCRPTMDAAMCWPASPPGTLVLLPCFTKFRGITYHGKNNASRYCYENGTWEEKANYSDCTQVFSEAIFNDYDYDQVVVERAEYTSIIYMAGYSLSLVTLTVATWIFTYFRDLRCLRNTIHTNLFVTYILADSLWIISLSLELMLTHSPASCVTSVLLHYCHVATFFWMFVEGHYLYMLVVQTFSADKIRCRLYMLIGWGLPVLVMATWVLVKVQTTDTASQQSPSLRHQSLGSTAAPVRRSQLDALGFEEQDEEEMYAQCPWVKHSSWDWVYMGPTIVVLSLNFIFLIRIMWVLITKLRSTNSAETQQYKKATKALLVLVPLLGVTYILVIAPPTPEGLLEQVFAYLQPIMISTQGLAVALIYCFFNSEVRTSVRTHYRRWCMERSLGRLADNSPRPFQVSRRSSATEMTFMVTDPSGQTCGKLRRFSTNSQNSRCQPEPDTV